MKKSIVNTVVTWILVSSMAMSFGWFGLADLITTKHERTVFLANGVTKTYVTVYNLNDEIIDEYVVTRGGEL